MQKFEYAVLVGMDQAGVPGGVVWFLNGGQNLGPQLIQALNQLGANGWDVAGIGDLGFTARAEILLKRAI